MRICRKHSEKLKKKMGKCRKESEKVKTTEGETNKKQWETEEKNWVWNCRKQWETEEEKILETAIFHYWSDLNLVLGIKTQQTF